MSEEEYEYECCEAEGQACMGMVVLIGVSLLALVIITGIAILVVRYFHV